MAFARAASQARPEFAGAERRHDVPLGQAASRAPTPHNRTRLAFRVRTPSAFRVQLGEGLAVADGGHVPVIRGFRYPVRSARMRQLNIESLFRKTPRLSQGCTLLRGEAAAVCLDSQGHPQKCHLEVEGDFTEKFRVSRCPVTDAMKAGHNDDVKAVEHGAEGVAFLLMLRLTPYRVVQQSKRGRADDWWLAPRGKLFQDAARLECSGILAGDHTETARRTKEKVDRLRKARPTRPTYVCVTNFKHARARVVML